MRLKLSIAMIPVAVFMYLLIFPLSIMNEEAQAVVMNDYMDRRVADTQRSHEMLWWDGVKAERAGDYQEAEWAYLQAVTNYGWPNAAANLGSLWNQSGRAEKTVPLLTQIIENRGRYNQACWTNLVMAHRRLGEYEEAWGVLLSGMAHGIEFNPDLIDHIRPRLLTGELVAGRVGGE